VPLDYVDAPVGPVLLTMFPVKKEVALKSVVVEILRWHQLTTQHTFPTLALRSMYRPITVNTVLGIKPAGNGHQPTLAVPQREQESLHLPVMPQFPFTTGRNRKPTLQRVGRYRSGERSKPIPRDLFNGVGFGDALVVVENAAVMSRSGFSIDILGRGIVPEDNIVGSLRSLLLFGLLDTGLVIQNFDPTEKIPVSP
jgi:hypothetical protein